MNKKMKAGLIKSLTRSEMKNVFGGLREEAKCSDSNCRMKDDGTRSVCPSGCSCDSSEEKPCY